MTLTVISFNPRLPIGFSLEPHSCKVAVVDKDGVAARRGVKPGWKVLSVNDSSVTARNVKSALDLLRTPYRVQFYVPSKKKKTKDIKPRLPFRKSDSSIGQALTDAPNSRSPSFRLVREGGSYPRSPSLRLLESADEKSPPMAPRSSDGARRQWGTEAPEWEELPSINSSNILTLEDRSISRCLQARNSWDESPEYTRARMSMPVEKMELPRTHHRWSRSSEDDSSSALALTANSLPTKSAATIIYRQVTPDSLISYSTIDFDRDMFYENGPQILRTDLDGKPLAKKLDLEMKLGEKEIFDTTLKHREATKGDITEPYSDQSSESFKDVLIQRGTATPTSETDQETSSSEESTSDRDNEHDDQRRKYIAGLIRGGDTISEQIATSTTMIIPYGWGNNIQNRQDKDFTEEPVNAAGGELFVESKSIEESQVGDEVFNDNGDNGDKTITNIVFENLSSLEDISRLPSLEMLSPHPQTKSLENSPSVDLLATQKVEDGTTISLYRDNPLWQAEKETDEFTRNLDKKETTSSVEVSSDDDSSDDDSSEEDSSENSTEEKDEFGYIKSLIRGVPMMPKGLTTDKPKKKSTFILVPQGYSPNRVD